MTLWLWATARKADGSLPATSLVIESAGGPDLVAIDELARRILEVKRTGRRLIVDYLAPELADLLDLAGIDLPGLGVEVQGETEGREESHRVDGMEEER